MVRLKPWAAAIPIVTKVTTEVDHVHTNISLCHDSYDTRVLVKVVTAITTFSSMISTTMVVRIFGCLLF